jgi:uncharacterized membrane-anchored protein YitT (DUF2179 family)
MKKILSHFNFMHSNRKKKTKIIKEFLIINIGILLVSSGTVFFKAPNHFALGGITGFSIVLQKVFTDYPIGLMTLVMNVVLLIIGLIFLNRSIIGKSIYCSIMLSVMIWALEILFPINATLTNQKLLELIFGVFLPGAGIALVFNYGATTGGTDIIAKILNKYLKIKIAVAVLCSDFLIALAAGFTFGVEAGLFSIFGVCLKSFVLDSVLENLPTNKIIVLISKEHEKIERFIIEQIKRDATIHQARGVYTNEEKTVITTILSSQQAIKLQMFIKSVDSSAFITISNSSKIIGKGFEGFD